MRLNTLFYDNYESEFLVYKLQVENFGFRIARKKLNLLNPALSNYWFNDRLPYLSFFELDLYYNNNFYYNNAISKNLEFIQVRAV